MAYKRQSDKEIEMKKARKYVFEHKNTREIEGFNKLKMAKSIVLSPSWIPTSEASKKLFKAEKARLNPKQVKE